MKPYVLAQADVDGASDDLAAEEQAVALTLGPARRAEFAAGRRAARAALAELLGGPGARFVIARHPDGAPFLVDRSGHAPGVALSITHAGGRAAAAAGHLSLLGLDLCERAQAPRVRRVTERFLDPDERALADGGDDTRWAALWALKEASAKALRRGLLTGDGLHASRLAALAPTPRFAWPALACELLVQETAVLAIVWSP